jgi:site-specific recombinase XerD
VVIRLLLCSDFTTDHVPSQYQKAGIFLTIVSTESPKTTELAAAPPTLPSVAIQEAAADAEVFATASRAASTWRAYESDWRIFNRWCQAMDLAPLPAAPATVAMFLAAEAKRGTAPSTLNRRLSAIRLMHLGARAVSPHNAVEIQEVMRGIRRLSTRGVVKKEAAVDEQIKRMVDTCNAATYQGKRDRALLLLGFAGALRRSELVALNVAHLKVSDEGFVVTVAKSKTDQEGEGQTIAIPRVPDSPYCPVQAVLDWMTTAGIEQEALFRRVTKGNKLTQDRLTDQSVARVIKRLAARAGLMASQYAGHSLRSGFLTSAAQQRASIFKMEAQSRHKSLDVLSGCVRAHELFEDHAGEGLLTSKKGDKGS